MTLIKAKKVLKEFYRRYSLDDCNGTELLLLAIAEILLTIKEQG